MLLLLGCEVFGMNLSMAHGDAIAMSTVRDVTALLDEQCLDVSGGWSVWRRGARKKLANQGGRNFLK